MVGNSSLEERSHVTVNGTELENVHSFVYLGAKQHGDGDEEADRDTATKPVVNLLLLFCHRRMRYLGHLLHMPPERLVRRSLLAP